VIDAALAAEVAAVTLRRHGIPVDPAAVAMAASARAPRTVAQWVEALAQEIEACQTTSASS
jgi:hypothetical protein